MTRIDDYDYELPPELIAQAPLPHRADSRMLVVRRWDQTLHHAHVRDLPEWLTPKDSLVLNDTRVLPARLEGRRAATGGKWGGLFIRSDASGLWQVLSKTRGRLSPGDIVTLIDREGRAAFGLRMVQKMDDGSWVVKPDQDGTPEQLLAGVGRVPLPPYIRKGEMEEADVDRYQTVYAERAGAVAAPTAGLHFTDRLLERIRGEGVSIEHVTLHVGLGTFRPVTAENLDDHQMHFEEGELLEETANRLREIQSRGGRVIAVGTTSVRVLETAAASGKLQPWRGETDLFIQPGYQFQAINGLLTNFHLPRSTLLVLVRTFGGDELMIRAYEEAIAERYRFYSYGDAMLII